MKRSGLEVMKRLIVLVKPLCMYMMTAIFMGLLGNLCATFLPFTAVLAGFSFCSADFAISVKTIAVILLLLAIARAILRYGEQTCNHYIAFSLLALIRDRVFTRMRKLAPAKLENKDSGNLLSVVTSDIELLEVFYAHTISPTAIAFLYSLVLIAVLGRFHVLFGVTALVSYFLIGCLVPYLTARHGFADGQAYRKETGKMSGFVLESLRGLDEIQQYGQGDKRLSLMNRKSERLAGLEGKMKRNTGMEMSLTAVLIHLLDLFLFAGGCVLLSRGYISSSQLILATVLFMSSFGPVVALADLGSTLSPTIAAGNRVLDILDETPVTKELDGYEKTVFNGAKASHVTFGYEKEPVLEDGSLSVKKGKILGISGKSGSGKSTLLRLFMRFWSTQKGEIEIGERNINEINTENLREMEGFMTQTTHLFHDSIRHNIDFVKPSASQEEIEEACRRAGIHDFIQSLPKGYDTEVGELGDTLSSGEKQRIGLARAFLHDAPFLLLDEPTSNLDILNEAAILKSIVNECKDRTVLIVSHRKSTLAIADDIVKVERGRVS